MLGLEMSIEELKIRGELEKEVERVLEEEMKDEICRLALRLHRMYLQQRERKATETCNLGGKDHSGQGRTKAKLVSEVNINIKVEGGTKIEIKEIKKHGGDNRAGIPRIGNARGIMTAAPNGKKFDWAKSLRSGKNYASTIVDNRIEGSNQSHMHGIII